MINIVERRNSILVDADFMTEDWLSTWLIGENHTISFQFYVTGELQKWEPKNRELCVFLCSKLEGKDEGGEIRYL